MKIKIFFVTYKEEKVLNDSLTSFFDTYEGKVSEINIINNFSSLQIDKFKNVNILNNVLRPDFSTGHLSRNWNQAILHGFKDINNPDCDLLIHCQNDVIFMDGWVDRLLDIHKKYSFFATGAGDCFCSYTIDAIKDIGIWDERYCGIGYQEADYFVRAAFHAPNKVSINDFGHRRVLNPIELPVNDIEGFDAYKKIGVCYKSTHGQGQNIHHKLAAEAGHEPSMMVFKNKFMNIDVSDVSKSANIGINSGTIYSGRLKTSMLYPYFEKNIPNRIHKDYIN